MILVIADDLTGAAELAGIGHRYGLKTEIQTSFYEASGTDLIVLDTNSRSISAPQARRKLEKSLRRIRATNIDWIYKKTDSVLRGPVIQELEVLISFLGKKRVCLMPANPSRQRIIRNGHYFIEGKPLTETDFAEDPEYPATSSDIVRLLQKDRSTKLFFWKKKHPLPEEGIMISDAVSMKDVQQLAKVIDKETLPAGAADFFCALLEKKGFSRQKKDDSEIFQKDPPQLFIAGSSFGLSSPTIKSAIRNGIPVLSLPVGVLKSGAEVPAVLREWTEKIVSTLKHTSCALVAINQPSIKNPIIIRKFTHYLSLTTKEVLTKILIKNLFIEGGSTASEVVKFLKWKRFTVLTELSAGIVQIQVIGKFNINISLKPGSYSWPDFIWKKISS